MKSGRFYRGIDEAALRRLCIRLAPVKVYMSVLDFLHPEIVGCKCKLTHSFPALRGKSVLDIDSPGHSQGTCSCFTCLERAKWLTIWPPEAVEWYYHDIEIIDR